MTPEVLENRLVDFAVLIINVSSNLQNSNAGKNMSNQIVRSGTSPALNYGEARSAESKKDFVHKVKIVLKELRETRISLKIINKANLYKGDVNLLRKAANECEELISIFVSSSKTVQKSIPKYR
ncbi:MAG: four helix bundle protein [Bacteroidetes bacterium]|nr:MAG: four helix bundle protein [Bacteroidota bacterium]